MAIYTNLQARNPAQLQKKQRENIRSRFREVAIFDQYLALDRKQYKIWP